MHLFPAPYAGLHPAFPPYVSWKAGHPALPLAGIPSLAYLAPAVASTILRRPVGWISTSNFVAYGALVTTAYGCLERFQTGKRAEAFLREQNIEIPKGRILDRLGHFDIDNAIILGAAAGVVIASWRHRPESVTGWKRRVAAMSVGVCGGGFLFTIKVALAAAVNDTRKAEMDEREAQAKEAVKWRGPVNLAYHKTKAGFPDLPTGSEPLTEHSLGRQTTASPELPRQSQFQLQPGSPKSVPPSEKIGFDLRSWPNLTNEPHLTLRDSPDADPVPYADTNYLWKPSPGLEIPELEAHIAKLRHKRHQRADEAEYLWRWLAKKEAQYYNFKDAEPESDEKVKLRRYLEILGNVQTKVWLEVSRLDWMIENAKKRTEQLRSADEDGKVTWLPPPPSSTASTTESQMSGEILQGYVKLAAERKKFIEKARADIASDLANPEMKLEDTMIQDEYGQWKNIREAGKELSERLELDWINAVLDEEVANRVADDGEQGAGK